MLITQMGGSLLCCPFGVGSSHHCYGLYVFLLTYFSFEWQLQPTQVQAAPCSPVASAHSNPPPVPFLWPSPENTIGQLHIHGVMHWFLLLALYTCKVDLCPAHGDEAEVQAVNLQQGEVALRLEWPDNDTHRSWSCSGDPSLPVWGLH